MQKTTFTHLEAGAECFANPGAELVDIHGERVRVSDDGMPMRYARDSGVWYSCDTAFINNRAPFARALCPEAELPELPEEIEAHIKGFDKICGLEDWKAWFREGYALIIREARKP